MPLKPVVTSELAHQKMPKYPIAFQTVHIAWIAFISNDVHHDQPVGLGHDPHQVDNDNDRVNRGNLAVCHDALLLIEDEVVGAASGPLS